MKVLLLGATGLLGKDVERVLISHGHVVVSPNRFVLQSRWGILTYDWMNYNLVEREQAEAIERMLKAHQPDVLINCIALVSADLAEKDERRAELMNATFPGACAIACREQGVQFIHISTDYVFSGAVGNSSLWRETDGCAPLSEYGKSKRIGEIFVQKHNRNSYILRTSWLFGSGKPNWLDLAFEHRYFDLYTNTYGTPTYTVDVAQAINAVISDWPEPGIYHCANSLTVPMTKFETMTLALFMVGEEIGTYSMRGEIARTIAPRPYNTALNSDKLKVAYTMPHALDAVRRYLKEVGKIK